MDKNKITWIVWENIKKNNSAYELGREYLEFKGFCNCEIVCFKDFFSFLKAILFSKTIYFQVSNPVLNVIMLAVSFRKKLIVHCLDNIGHGYPRWARLMGLAKLVHCLINKATIFVAISPLMARYFKRLNPSLHAEIYHRIHPDHIDLDSEEKIAEKKDKAICFFGNVNYKTNLMALMDLSKSLRKIGWRLDLYTRTIDEDINRYLVESGVNLCGEVAPEQVISLTKCYPFQALPFNFDKDSYNFYRFSMPSKLPNLVASGVPVFYYGPKRFYLKRYFSKKYPSVIFSDSLDDL